MVNVRISPSADQYGEEIKRILRKVKDSELTALQTESPLASQVRDKYGLRVDESVKAHAADEAKRRQTKQDRIFAIGLAIFGAVVVVSVAVVGWLYFGPDTLTKS
jgi:hypothetical protein